MVLLGIKNASIPWHDIAEVMHGLSREPSSVFPYGSISKPL